jgi:hypothetical protein
MQKAKSRFGKSMMKHTNTSYNKTTKKTFADKIGIKSKRKGNSLLYLIVKKHGYSVLYTNKFRSKLVHKKIFVFLCIVF